MTQLRQLFMALKRRPGHELAWGYVGGAPSNSSDISGYLSLFMNSVSLADSRRGRYRYYAALQSFISVELGEESADFACVASPGYFKDIDPARSNMAILARKRLLGPIPYRGGDVDLDVGLVAMRSTDLLGPYLEVLETLSAAGGVTFPQLAKPFVVPVTKGIDLLLNAGTDVHLEVALSTVLEKIRPGIIAVTAASRDDFDVSTARLTPEGVLLDSSGRPLRASYFTLEFSMSEIRDDWQQIPEIRQSIRDVRDAVLRNLPEEVEARLDQHRRVALSSPSLLPEHAELVVAEVRNRYGPAVGTALTGGSLQHAQVPTIDDLHPFGSVAIEHTNDADPNATPG
jgi:hypothetical protein